MRYLAISLTLVLACGSPPEPSDPNRPDLSDLLDAGSQSADASDTSPDASDTTPDAGPSSTDAGAASTDAGAQQPDTGPAAVATTYGLKAVASVLQTNPSPLGNGEVAIRTTMIILVEAEQQGSNLTWTEQLCSMNTSDARWGLVRATTSYPAAFIEHFPRLNRQGTLTETGDFNAGPLATVVGAELDRPLTDPLPTEPGGRGEVDGDRDGQPGVTVQVGGTVSGEVYVAQRSRITMRGRLRQPGRIEGLWTSEDERSVLAASRDLLMSEVVSRRDPDQAASYFILQRIDDGTDCAALIRSAEQTFAP